MIENSSNDNLVIEESEYQSQRTIEEVIDVETGEIVSAEDFFSQDEAIIIRARAILEISIQSDVPKYKCLFCEQSVKISGRRIFERNKMVYFFAHFKDSNDCPIKTGVKLGLEELLAKKYHGLRESELHLTLKNFIADSLRAETATQKGFHNVLVEATFKNLDISNTWRRPDVKAAFLDKNIVFELQLSTTFLSVVVGRDAFYRQHETYIIWAFGGLNTVAEWQKLMEKDIYYAHKRNVFLIDEEAKIASKEQGELVLHCYWQIPKIVDGKVQIEWHKKLVTLDQLTYDEATYEAYYYNSDKDFYEIADAKEKAIIDAWDKAKEERWDKIKFRIGKRKQPQIPIPTRFKLDEKWGYKIKNQVTVEAQYASAKAYKYGVALVKDSKGEKNIIDLSGNTIIELGSENVLDISVLNGAYLKLELDKSKKGYKRLIKFSLIYKIYDFSGNIIFEELKDFEKGKAKAKKNEKWGYVNEALEVLIPFEYDEIQDFIEGKARVRKNGKYGYIDEIGNIQIEKIVSLGETRNKIQKLGLWGLSNLEGKEITDCIYDEIKDFVNGKVKAQKNSNWGYIDENGKILIPFEYEGLQNFINDKVIVKKNRKWGYINSEGEILIPFEYDEIKDFVLERAIVQKNSKWGYINAKGEVLTPFIYDEIQDFIDEKAIVKKNGKYGSINEVGEISVPCIFFESIVREISQIKTIDGVEIYENKIGEIIIPSFGYLANSDIFSVFKMIPIKAKVDNIVDLGIILTFYNGRTNNGLLHNSEIEKARLDKRGNQISIKSNVDVRIPDGNFPIKGKISLEERTYNQFVIGSIIEVYIKNIDIPTGKISFTLRKPIENYKALKSQDESVYKELKTLEGSIVEGKVTNIKDFGVFIEICEGVTGLLHISVLKQYGINEKKIEKYFAKGDILSKC